MERTRKLSLGCMSLLASGLAAIGFTEPAHASTIAQDSFNYTAGSALATQNGGTGWNSGWTLGTGSSTAWTGAAGATNGVPTVSATNLPYSTFSGSGDSGGSAQFFMSVAGGTAGSISRTFTNAISATTTGTFYGSVEFEAPTSIKWQNYYQLTMNDTTVAANGQSDAIGTANGSLHAIDVVAAGATAYSVSNSGSGAPSYGGNADDAATSTALIAASNAQHMFVFQVDTGVSDPSNSAPAVRISLWADPNLSQSLGTPGSVLYYDLNSAEQANGTITGVRFQGASQASTTAGRNILMDEVAFGTTAADVGVQVPEPASLGLISLGGLVLLRRRRA